MKISRITINAGIGRPTRLLHIADTHLALANAHDSKRRRELAARRQREFETDWHHDETLRGRDEPGCCIRYLDEAIAYAGSHCDLLLYGGDLIDFMSEGNFDFVQRRLAGIDWLFTPGNHEYSTYIFEEFTDLDEPGYRERGEHRLGEIFGDKLDFSARQLNGLNLIALDNANFQFTATQLEQLKHEAEKSLPILLLVHVPLFAPEMFQYITRGLKIPCAYCAGVPEELMVGLYPQSCRAEQTPTPETLAVIDFLRHARVAAVLAGHQHFGFTSALWPGVMQYTVPGGYTGHANEYTVI